DEGRDLVDHLVIQPLDDVLHHVAQVLEIEQQSGLIQVFSSERYAHLVVVPVRVFAFPLVIAQVVACGKRVLDRNLVHESPGGPHKTAAPHAPIQPNILREESILRWSQARASARKMARGPRIPTAIPYPKSAQITRAKFST